MWDSAFLRGWQEDYNTLDRFVVEELPTCKYLTQDLQHLSSEERGEVLSGLAHRVATLLNIPEKWQDYPTLQRRMGNATREISSFKAELEACNLESKVVKEKADPPQHHPVDLLLNYYRSKGIVGEDKLCVLLTLCAASRMHVGLEGTTGSGKTLVMDALLGLLPQGRVYTVGLSSKTAVFQQADEINKCSFLYIPELQKAQSPLTVELIKDLAEGRDAQRMVAAGKNKVTCYNIKAGKTIFYTLAQENAFKKDAETARRFVVVYTNHSKEHAQDVLAHKSKARFVQSASAFSPTMLGFLKVHIAHCLAQSQLDVKDPFAAYMSQHLPSTHKVASKVDQYFGLLNAYAVFNVRKRTRQGSTLFLTLEDHYMVHALYHDMFLKQLGKISAGAALENKEVDWQACWEAGRAQMREHYPKLVHQWVNQQTTAKGIGLYDPLRQEEVTLAKSPTKAGRVSKLVCLSAIGLFYLGHYGPGPKLVQPEKPAQVQEADKKIYKQNTNSHIQVGP